MNNPLAISSFWAFVGLVIGFGFVIFVHELGHFLVAKAVGIKATQFAIGFGHAILAYRKGLGVRIGSTEGEYQKCLEEGRSETEFGETEYRLNWIPFGGYVKMLGQEDLDPTANSDDERAFNRKPIWARACVVCAGVVMNLIFGVLFFVASFLQGVQFPPAYVGSVLPGAPAALAYAVGHEDEPAYQGLRMGDHITAIDGSPINDFMEIAVSTALAKRKQVLELTVDREGEANPLVYRMQPKTSKTTKLLSLGIEPAQTTTIETVITEGSYTELHRAGVRSGMQVTVVDGQRIDPGPRSFGSFYRAVVAKRGLPVQTTFADPQSGTTVNLEMFAKAELYRPSEGPAHLLGLVPAVRINEVLKKSPAQLAGILPGDFLAQLGSEAWPSLHQVARIVHDAKNQSLQLHVWRDGKIVQFPSIAPKKGIIGISMVHDELVVGRTLPDTPAAALNLMGGSRITSINDKHIETWSDLQRELQLTTEDATDLVSMTLGYDLPLVDQTQGQESIALGANNIAHLAQARWSLSMRSGFFAMARHTVQADTAFTAAILGMEKTQQFIVHTYITLARLFQGTVKPEHLRGPVGIAHEGTKIATQGVSYLLFFLGVISVNLVVINFLPIPITDGGLMVFLIIEKLKGSPLSPRIQTAAFYIGLTLIGGVIAITLFYDTLRLPFLN